MEVADAQVAASAGFVAAHTPSLHGGDGAEQQGSQDGRKLSGRSEHFSPSQVTGLYQVS